MKRRYEIKGNDIFPIEGDNLDLSPSSKFTEYYKFGVFNVYLWNDDITGESFDVVLMNDKNEDYFDDNVYEAELKTVGDKDLLWVSFYNESVGSYVSVYDENGNAVLTNKDTGRFMVTGDNEYVIHELDNGDCEFLNENMKRVAGPFTYAEDLVDKYGNIHYLIGKGHGSEKCYALVKKDFTPKTKWIKVYKKASFLCELMGMKKNTSFGFCYESDEDK